MSEEIGCHCFQGKVNHLPGKVEWKTGLWVCYIGFCRTMGLKGDTIKLGDYCLKYVKSFMPAQGKLVSGLNTKSKCAAFNN